MPTIKLPTVQGGALGAIIALIVLVIVIALMVTSQLAVWPLGALLAALAIARLT